MLKQDSSRGKASSKGVVLCAVLHLCSFLLNATLCIEQHLIFMVMYLIIFLLIEGYFHLDGREKSC